MDIALPAVVPPEVKATVSPTVLFTAGMMGGFASTISGHPFDTIKVRLQTQRVEVGKAPYYRGPIDCFIKICREEGVRGLFKGISAPLSTRAIINAISFSSYGFYLDYLAKMTSGHSDVNFNNHPILNIGIAGMGAGITTTIVTTPAELVKIRLQVQQGKNLFDPNEKFPGVIRGSIMLIKEHGIQALFRGWKATMYRDMVGSSVFFMSYYAIRNRADPADGSFNMLTPLISLMAGGIAGIVCWIAIYPFDMWKSNVQRAKEFPVSPAHRSFITFMKERWQNMGIRAGLFTGLGPTLIRALPVNSSKILVYDLVVRLLSPT